MAFSCGPAASGRPTCGGTRSGPPAVSRSAIAQGVTSCSASGLPRPTFVQGTAFATVRSNEVGPCTPSRPTDTVGVGRTSACARRGRFGRWDMSTHAHGADYRRATVSAELCDHARPLLAFPHCRAGLVRRRPVRDRLEGSLPMTVAARKPSETGQNTGNSRFP